MAAGPVKRLIYAPFTGMVMRGNLYRIRDRRFLLPFISGPLREAAGYWPAALGKFKPKKVFDIGAFNGDVSAGISELYRPEFMALVEPKPEMANILRTKVFAPRQMVFECALGKKAGSADFNVLDFPAASSLLEISPGMGELFHQPMGIEKRITVGMRTLDDIFIESGVDLIDLMKIDVQGYELEVFKGGKAALEHTKMIVSEVMFFEHYMGQPLFEDIYQYLKAAGFRIRTTAGWVYDRKGLALFADAVFMNERFFHSHA